MVATEPYWFLFFHYDIFFILTSNRWKLNLAYQMLSLPHLHSISTSWTFDWPFNFLPFCINCAFRQLFLNIILTIVNHLLFQNQFQIPLQTISSPLIITTVLSYHIERLPKMWAALLAPSLPVKKGGVRKAAPNLIKISQFYWTLQFQSVPWIYCLPLISH